MKQVLVRLKGPIGPNMAAMFDDVDMHVETILTGELVDDAAVHGLLTRVRDLGLRVVDLHVSDTPHSQPLPSSPHDRLDATGPSDP
ncbi:MAG: hypothetical protein E4H05_11040 [Acidimicrobiales bacterium]|nr:MAG: hypothetical protein E4H05_11040 [Acidimicrobiales bacterium]